MSAERTGVNSPEKTKVTDSRAPTPALEIYRTTEALGGGTKNPCARVPSSTFKHPEITLGIYTVHIPPGQSGTRSPP